LHWLQTYNAEKAMWLPIDAALEAYFEA